jgi:hypothetical protein
VSATATAEQPPAPHLRLLLVAPPAFVVIVAAFLVVQSFRAWGAADIAELPDWEPTAAGLIAAAVVGVPNAALLRYLLTTTSRPILTSFLLVPFAAAVMIGFGALALELALRLPKESSYEHLLEDSKSVVSPTGAFVYAGVAGGLAFALAYGASVIYAAAVQPNAGTRFDKRGHEPDAMGALIAEDERRAT